MVDFIASALTSVALDASRNIASQILTNKTTTHDKNGKSFNYRDQNGQLNKNEKRNSLMVKDNFKEKARNTNIQQDVFKSLASHAINFTGDAGIHYLRNKITKKINNPISKAIANEFFQSSVDKIINPFLENISSSITK
jgi:hypothetical protein